MECEEECTDCEQHCDECECDDCRVERAVSFWEGMREARG